MTTTTPLNSGSQPTAATGTSRTAPTRTINVHGTPFAYRELGPRGGVPPTSIVRVGAVLDVADRTLASRVVVAVMFRLP